MPVAPIPLTVIGGYLGAGKTTLLNRLLADPGGRRLGVIVNDFGTLGIDVDLLRGAGDTDIISLPNGCVCCTLGSDLYTTLQQLRSSAEPPDQIVIEVSGVADPAVAAAWGTTTGFEPGGVIVLAAADTVRRQSRDKYVGGEVLAQLRGADLIVVTKLDLCDPVLTVEVGRWLDDVASEIARVEAVNGDIPVDVVLGMRPELRRASATPHHTDTYATWSWDGGALGDDACESLLRQRPAGLLRLKGVIEHLDGRHSVIQAVGNTWQQTDLITDLDGTRLMAIGIAGIFDPRDLERAVHPDHRV